jgi:hypothetical protein
MHAGKPGNDRSNNAGVQIHEADVIKHVRSGIDFVRRKVWLGQGVDLVRSGIGYSVM